VLVIDPTNKFRGKNARQTGCKNLMINPVGGFVRCRKKDICDACFHNFLRHWEMRLGCQAFGSRMVLFVTLTFNEQNLWRASGTDHAVFKQYIQNLRRAGYDVRYVAAFEYGEKTGRPHYHAIICFGQGGDFPDFPLNVRADLPHWTHGHSQYEIPRSRASALQYTLGYVLKGGGYLLRPSMGFGKAFLLNYAEMLGRNKRPLVQAFKGNRVIKINVPGMVVRKTGIDGQGIVKTYDLPVSHDYGKEMVALYVESYFDRYGQLPPDDQYLGLGGDY